MHDTKTRPNRRPTLYLPAFLSTPHGAAREAGSFPLSPDQLRRTVAEMIG
ncbi:MAG: hypothetical protein ACJ8DZ_03130 [Allosphingosinicella sp.]